MISSFFNRGRYWPLRPLVEWAFSYPLLILASGALLAVVLGAGHGLGLPSLFHSEHRYVQLVAGLSVALSLADIVFVGYLLDAGTDGFVEPPEWDEHHQVSLLVYFFGSWVYPALLFAVCASALLLSGPPWLWAAVACGFGALLVLHSWIGPWGTRLLAFFAVVSAFASFFVHDSALGLGSLAGGALVLLIILRVPRILGWIEPPVSWLARAPLLGRPLGILLGDERARTTAEGRLRLLQLVLAVVCVVLWGATSLISLIARDSIPPALVFCMLVAIVSAVYGAIRFAAPRRGFGLFSAIVVLFLLVATAFPTTFLDLEERTVALGSRPAPSTSTLPIDEWLGSGPAAPCARSPGRTPKLVVVAASGGGVRAAVWTAAVLEHLDQELPCFTPELRLITGASGGMVGAGAFVSLLHERGTPRHAAEMIGQDSLSALARALLVPGDDRGTALQKAWEAHTGGAMALRFGDLLERERRREIPSLIYSPMLVEDGRRLLISNLDLAEIAEARGLAKTGMVTFSTSAFELSKYFAGTGLKLSTAARMSASFPYVSPATLLPTDPPRRIVDAGYYDNYGVNIAARLLFAYREAIGTVAPGGVVIIQIRDSLSLGSRNRLDHPKPSGSLLVRGLAWLSSPIEAVLNARESTMTFRNDELLSWLTTVYGREGQQLEVFTFELPSDAPLSWHLTTKERECIIAEAAGTAAEACDLRLSEDAHSARIAAREENAREMERLREHWP